MFLDWSRHGGHLDRPLTERCNAGDGVALFLDTCAGKSGPSWIDL